jgi:hypothetical protein
MEDSVWRRAHLTPEQGPPRILSLARSTRNDRQLRSARRSLCCRPSVKIINGRSRRLYPWPG